MTTPEIQVAGDRVVLRLPEQLGVADGPALRTCCLEAARTGLPLTVDASGVRRMHSAALQCLVALERHRREHGGTVEWTGTSDDLARQIEGLGLTPWTGHGQEA